MLLEAAEPLGPLEAADPPPLMPPVEDEAPPLEEAAPPAPELLVPPVAPALPESVLDEAEEPLGVLGALLEEDEEPPGTTIVSFVVEEDEEPLGAALLPPGTTVVVSFFSQAERARAPIRTNRYPLRFMSTRLSFKIRCKMQHRA